MLDQVLAVGYGAGDAEVAAPSITGSSMTRPCSRAAGIWSGIQWFVHLVVARRQVAGQPVAGDRSRQRCRSAAIYTNSKELRRKRRLHAGEPPQRTFRTKIEMAIDQIRHAVAAGLPRGIVLADAAYDGARRFRDALRTSL